jgi:hypothetical protein
MAAAATQSAAPAAEVGVGEAPAGEPVPGHGVVLEQLGVQQPSGGEARGEPQHERQREERQPVGPLQPARHARAMQIGHSVPQSNPQQALERHAEKSEAVAEAMNVRGAIGAVPVRDRDVDQPEPQHGGRE